MAISLRVHSLIARAVPHSRLRVHSLIARAAPHSRASAKTAGPSLIKFGTREGRREGRGGGEGGGEGEGRAGEGRGGEGTVHTFHKPEPL